MTTRVPSLRSQQRLRAARARTTALAELPDDARGLLDDLSATQRDAWGAEARLLALVCAWVDANPHEERETAAASGLHGDREIPLAGEGAPLVSDFAVVEVAAHLGLSAESGSRVVAEALELRHRLPGLWRRVQDLELPSWRAKRIAKETIHLTPDAAAYVDEQLAPVAHTVGVPTIDKLVTRAKAEFMPEVAAREAQEAADGRHVGIALGRVGQDGTCRISGRLDVPDAVELNRALNSQAARRADEGDDEGLDARRAKSLGDLARLHLAEPEAKTPARDADLVVHLHPDSVGDDLVEVQDTRTLAHVNDLHRWLEGANVTIKPVIDLRQQIVVGGYRPSERIETHVKLRDPICVFPWCGQPSQRADLDHITSFDPHGPPGQTATDRLAPLCRRHHRAKTHGSWTYVMEEPGVYRVVGPHDQIWTTMAYSTIPDW